jgi:alpha-beta hydrolase superfamily lysophospholipase
MTTSLIVPFVLKGTDGVAFTAYRAVPESQPRGVVQIAHGMGEHYLRYAHVTERLTQAGYAVYANDHRGHGASAGDLGLGQFGPGGFQSLVDDMAVLSDVARGQFPGLPLVLLGHSMGSFASQLYLLEHSDKLAGLALSGTAALDQLAGALLAGGGPVTLEVLNAAFEPARTPFDWLSTDPAEVDAYIADPLCGFSIADEGMASMFGLGMAVRQDPRLEQVRKDLPVYVISGEFDPVVGPGQAYTNALIESFRAAGLNDVEHHVYAGGRHEMFNERDRDRVIADLVSWLGRKAG